MRVVILILSIIIAVKTFYYAMFEFKENDNKPAGVVITLLAITSLVAPNIALVL